MVVEKIGLSVERYWVVKNSSHLVKSTDWVIGKQEAHSEKYQTDGDSTIYKYYCIYFSLQKRVNWFVFMLLSYRPPSCGSVSIIVYFVFLGAV